MLQFNFQLAFKSVFKETGIAMNEKKLNLTQNFPIFVVSHFCSFKCAYINDSSSHSPNLSSSGGSRKAASYNRHYKPNYQHSSAINNNSSNTLPTTLSKHVNNPNLQVESWVITGSKNPETFQSEKSWQHKALTIITLCRVTDDYYII